MSVVPSEEFPSVVTTLGCPLATTVMGEIGGRLLNCIVGLLWVLPGNTS